MTKCALIHMPSKLMIAWFFLLGGYFSFAQNPLPAFKNYTVNDGLPSSEVYQILQDHQGYLWMATDRGVARYNGYEFKTFTTDNGLTQNVIFELYEDESKRLWFIALDGSLSYWEKDTIRTYPYNEAISKILRHKIFNSFHIDTLGQLMIGSKGNGLIRVNEKGEINQEHSPTPGVRFQKNGTEIYSYSTPPDNDTKLHTFTFNDLVLENNDSYAIRAKGVLIGKDLLAYNKFQSIVLYDLHKQQKLDEIEFNHRVTSFQLIDNQLFVGLEIGGLRCYQLQEQRFELLRHLLKGLTCSHVEKDNEGGYWISTIQKGVFYTPNFSVLSYTEQSGLHRDYVKELGVFQNAVLIGFNRNFQILDQKGLSNPILFKQKKAPKYMEGGRVYLEGHTIYNQVHQKLVDVEPTFLYPNAHFSGVPVKEVWNDSVLLCSRNLCYLYTDNQVEPIELHHKFSYIEDIELIDTEHFWIGSQKGLFKRMPDQIVDLSLQDSLFGHRIIALDNSPDLGLLIATRGAGLLMYKNGEVQQFGMAEGLLTNDLTNIYVDSVQNIWIATNQGLHRLSGQRDSLSIEYFTINDGLISNEVTDVLRLEQQLFVSTNKGLSIIDLQDFEKDNSNIAVRITDIYLDGQSHDNHQQIDIYPNHQFLEVNFLGLNYRALGDIEYRYRLPGWSEEWITTQKPTLRLHTFPTPRNAQLEIMARGNSNQAWGSTSTLIDLRFHPEFYQEAYFQAGLLLLALGLLYFAYCFQWTIPRQHKAVEAALPLTTDTKKKNYLIIEINKQNIRIDKKEILFIQSFKDYVEINTIDQKYLYRSTLKKMEERLSSLHFMRLHRSYIVRKDQIDSISKKQLSIREHTIPIGKTYVPVMKAFENQFYRLNS